MPLTLLCVSVASLVAVIRSRTMSSALFLIAVLSLSIAIGLRELAFGALADYGPTGFGSVNITPHYTVFVTSNLSMIAALLSAIAGSFILVISGRQSIKRGDTERFGSDKPI